MVQGGMDIDRAAALAGLLVEEIRKLWAQRRDLPARDFVNVSN